MLLDIATMHAKATNALLNNLYLEFGAPLAPGPKGGPPAPFAGALARCHTMKSSVSVHDINCEGVEIVHKATNKAQCCPTGQAPPLGPKGIVGVNQATVRHQHSNC